MQFKKPIAGYQLVQRKLVEMVSEITKAQLLCWRLGRLKEAGTITAGQISLAKRNCVAMARDIARDARDILGANGVTDEYQCGRHMLNLGVGLHLRGHPRHPHAGRRPGHHRTGGVRLVTGHPFRDPAADAPDVLICAGLDPSGGAGLIADVRVIGALGCRPVGVVTALTVQNTTAVVDTEAMGAERVREQLEFLLSDVEVRAVKIGMIGSSAIAEAVGRALALTAAPVVWDPIIHPSRGDVRFVDSLFGHAVAALAPHVTVLTPNAGELAFMTGATIAGLDDARIVGAALAERLRTAVLVKGGHLGGDESVDLLCHAGAGHGAARAAHRGRRARPRHRLRAVVGDRRAPRARARAGRRLPRSQGLRRGADRRPGAARAAARRRWCDARCRPRPIGRRHRRDRVHRHGAGRGAARGAATPSPRCRATPTGRGASSATSPA